MGDGVKPRNYDSSRRRARGRETRLRIIEAARELFTVVGYPATSIEAISSRADVGPATVYRLFGTKRDLLKAVIDVTAVGDDEPFALHERQEVITLGEEPDPARYLAGFARLARTVSDRLAPLQQMLRSAAPVDPEVAELLATVNAQRYTGQGAVSRGLVKRKALLDGMTESHAHDVVYLLMAPEVRHILTVERGWSADRYEQWLADTLCATLLKQGSPRS